MKKAEITTIVGGLIFAGGLIVGFAGLAELIPAEVWGIRGMALVVTGMVVLVTNEHFINSQQGQQVSHIRLLANHFFLQIPRF